MEAGITALVVAGTAGCGLSTGVDDDVLYDLVRYDGSALPAAAPFSGSVVSGRFRLALDGSCERTLTIVPPAPADTTEVEDRRTCTWTRDGDELAFTFPFMGDVGAGPTQGTSGTIDGETLTVEIETGIVCVTTPCPTRWTEEYERANQP